MGPGGVSVRPGGAGAAEERRLAWAGVHCWRAEPGRLVLELVEGGGTRALELDCPDPAAAMAALNRAVARVLNGGAPSPSSSSSSSPGLGGGPTSGGGASPVMGGLLREGGPESPPRARPASAAPGPGRHRGTILEFGVRNQDRWAGMLFPHSRFSGANKRAGAWHTITESGFFRTWGGRPGQAAAHELVAETSLRGGRWGISRRFKDSKVYFDTWNPVKSKWTEHFFEAASDEQGRKARLALAAFFDGALYDGDAQAPTPASGGGGTAPLDRLAEGPERVAHGAAGYAVPAAVAVAPPVTQVRSEGRPSPNPQPAIPPASRLPSTAPGEGGWAPPSQPSHPQPSQPSQPSQPAPVVGKRATRPRSSPRPESAGKSADNPPGGDLRRRRPPSKDDVGSLGVAEARALVSVTETLERLLHGAEAGHLASPGGGKSASKPAASASGPGVSALEDSAAVDVFLGHLEGDESTGSGSLGPHPPPRTPPISAAEELDQLRGLNLLERVSLLEQQMRLQVSVHAKARRERDTLEYALSDRVDRLEGRFEKFQREQKAMLLGLSGKLEELRQVFVSSVRAG